PVGDPQVFERDREVVTHKIVAHEIVEHQVAHKIERHLVLTGLLLASALLVPLGQERCVPCCDAYCPALCARAGVALSCGVSQPCASGEGSPRPLHAHSICPLKRTTCKPAAMMSRDGCTAMGARGGQLPQQTRTRRPSYRLLD